MAESLNVKPPPWLEFLVSRLVPPACREHVLGDFSERYTSPLQYAAMAVYRRELERQRDLLRTVTWWYLLPLLPAMVVLTLGQAIMRSQPAPALRAFGFVLLIGVLIRQLNHRVAHKLQHKIDRLTAALEKQG